jgi:hypothetical protein
MEKEELSLDSITFGKYVNQTIYQVLKDRNYCKWLLKQDWFQKNYEYLYNRIEEYNPKSYFLIPYTGESEDFINRYTYFNLTNVEELKIDLTEKEILCYKFYLHMILQLKDKIQNRIDEEKENIYNIKAPVKWLQKFEHESGLTREEFKFFLSAYELPNIPYIIEDIKKEGGILYKGARSFLISKKRSLEQEKYWEDILKEKYGEDISTQYKFENCIFDFLNIKTNTIFECKLGCKDFNESQHKKYLITLNKYRIIYLIGYDCVIDMERNILYTTNENKYILYFSQIPLMTESSKFDKLIVKYSIQEIEDLKILFGTD